MLKLFKIAGFLPYILVVFLNAFVDLGHKIIIQNTVFKTYDGQEQIILTAIVNALILLPFILLFTPAGFLADKYPKNNVIRISAFIAVCLTCLITLFYHLGYFWAAFGMTFLLAIQSAIYSPAKFGFIRELVGKNHLSSANGLVQAVTIIAILAGTFIFSIMFESLLKEVTYENKAELIKIIAPVGWVLIIGALIEFGLTFRLPQKQNVYEELHFDFDRYKRGDYLKNNLSLVYHHKVIWTSIIGLSIFWAICQVMLASFPAFAKETMGMLNTIIIQGMMACTGIGIMFGSITSGKYAESHSVTGLVLIGSIGIAMSISIIPFLGTPQAHAFNFFSVGFFGGLFIVPLNALIQLHAKERELGIVLAGYNFIQTTVMLFFLTTTVIICEWGLSTVGVIKILSFVAVAGAAHTIYRLPLFKKAQGSTTD
ncbi:MAG: MFS transporter [Gammaproteobacteria bacterium]